MDSVHYRLFGERKQIGGNLGALSATRRFKLREMTRNGANPLVGPYWWQVLPVGVDGGLGRDFARLQRHLYDDGSFFDEAPALVTQISVVF